MRFDFAGKPDYETNVLDEYGDLKSANDSLCQDVGAALSRFYPYRPWMVQAEIESGIVRVALQGFTQWPYIIKVATLKSDPQMASVRKAGGDLLTLQHMSREKFDMVQWQEAVRRYPHHFFRNKAAPV